MAGVKVTVEILQLETSGKQKETRSRNVVKRLWRIWQEHSEAGLKEENGSVCVYA